jgi:hypothetical protein
MKDRDRVVGVRVTGAKDTIFRLTFSIPTSSQRTGNGTREQPSGSATAPLRAKNIPGLHTGIFSSHRE